MPRRVGGARRAGGAIVMTKLVQHGLLPRCKADMKLTSSVRSQCRCAVASASSVDVAAKIKRGYTRAQERSRAGVVTTADGEHTIVQLHPKLGWHGARQNSARGLRGEHTTLVAVPNQRLCVAPAA